MKRKLVLITVVCMICLVGCGNSTEEDKYQKLEESTNKPEVEETETSSETEEVSDVTNNLSHDKKMEILAFINGMLDPL